MIQWRLSHATVLTFYVRSCIRSLVTATGCVFPIHCHCGACGRHHVRHCCFITHVLYLCAYLSGCLFEASVRRVPRRPLLLALPCSCGGCAYRAAAARRACCTPCCQINSARSLASRRCRCHFGTLNLNPAQRVRLACGVRHAQCCPPQQFSRFSIWSESVTACQRLCSDD